MGHEYTFISAVSAGLALAFFLGWIAARLHLPPLLGYLLVGVALGPYTPGFVIDAAMGNELMEMGVILLMFGVGLHFSIRDLWAVKSIAIPGAILQITCATAMGMGLAYFWDWSWQTGLLFGLALSVASTVVLLRAMEARGALETVNGRIAVGWLIVEDLAMVVALVLVPAMGNAEAADRSELAAALGWALVKVALFLFIMLVIGKRLVPWVLDLVGRIGNKELLLVALLGLALGSAYAGYAFFDISFALGAFFAGVILAESDLNHQANSDTEPLRDMFSVLFFISVGLLFDPQILWNAPLAVLAVLFVVLIGKSIAALALVVLFRYPVSTALIVAAALAQIGEFSFILAAIGMELGILTKTGQSLILATAILSIALNPAMFKLADLGRARVRKTEKLRNALDRSRKHRLAKLDIDYKSSDWSQHAIIAGFGKVGDTISTAFQMEKIPFVVIEPDRAEVLRLRNLGIETIYGDPTMPEVLTNAGVKSAKLVVICLPDAMDAGHVVEIAKRENSAIETISQCTGVGEKHYLESLGVGLAVIGERELAIGLMEYALVAAGIDENRSKSVVRYFRNSDKTNTEIRSLKAP